MANSRNTGAGKPKAAGGKAAAGAKSTTNKTANAAKSATDKSANAAKSTTDRVRENAEKARRTFQETVVDPAQRAGEAMKASGQKIAEQGASVGVKMIDQAETNAREAFAAMREAASAKDLSEVTKIQGEYLRDQSRRGMAQAREIGELIMQFGRDAVAPLKGDEKKQSV